MFCIIRRKKNYNSVLQRSRLKSQLLPVLLKQFRETGQVIAMKNNG